jgi:hypothetical protein
MLEDYYVKPSTIDRIRGSWLAPQIESYLEWLEAHGYSRLVVYRHLPLLFHFAEFTEKKGCSDIAFCKATEDSPSGIAENESLRELRIDPDARHNSRRDCFTPALSRLRQ